MSNIKTKRIVTTVVTSETLDSFFKRGKESAALLDEKKIISPRKIISFEDKKDLAAFLTQNKFKLVATVRKRSETTISKLAEILKRSRASVDRDVQQLESIGIVTTEIKINPGHGKCKVVRAADDMPIQLQVQTVI